MKFSFKMSNLDKVNNKLAAMSTMTQNVAVKVGFKAPYALAVHELVAMKLKGLPRGEPWGGFYWDPQGEGQAKFLEEPARTKRSEIAAAVKNDMEKNGFWSKAIFAGALVLMTEAMRLAPWRTGDLRASGYIIYETP